MLHRREARHHRIAFGRYLAEHLPDARLQELDGADTFPFHVGDVEPLLSAIELFLTGAEHARSNRWRRLATIAVSDIVGSTQLAARLGDAGWRALLHEHDRVVRGLITEFRGEELAHTGDGLVASFDGPTRAVACAQQTCAAVEQLGLRLRIGLHTGEVDIGPDGASGLAIHLASRVMRVAEDGGVVVTRTVKDLAFGSNIDFVALGAHRLKGVPEPWELFRVGAIASTGA